MSCCTCVVLCCVVSRLVSSRLVSSYYFLRAGCYLFIDLISISLILNCAMLQVDVVYLIKSSMLVYMMVHFLLQDRFATAQKAS